ncbi:NADPH-dependent FMN reductase [Alkalinema sp. FACHB-956]|nr:NADPH-dependent FMN reductase [Alkalinema sp. FACHB-956]
MAFCRFLTPFSLENVSGVLVFGRYDSPALVPIKEKLEKADAILLATPVYKASYTGLLKSFLDLLPQKALVNKTVLPLVTAGTIAHLLAIEYSLKPVLGELGARRFASTVYAVDQQLQRQEDGSVILDEEIKQRFDASLQELIDILQSIEVSSKELVQVN